MAHLDPVTNYNEFKERTLEGIKAHFPIKGSLQTLELEKLEVKDSDYHPDKIKEQYDARVKGESWAAPVVGHFVLRDTKTGEVINRDKVKLTDLPMMTRRYTYVVDGKEYQVNNQWQLKPGVYVKRRATGELEAAFNIPSKKNFDVVFDPTTKQFNIWRGGSKTIGIYPVLKTMGVSDDELEKAWGKEVFAANKHNKSNDKALSRFYRVDKGRLPHSEEEATKYLHDTMLASALRPDAVEATLGHKTDHVNGQVLAAAATKLVKVQAGAPEDDRDSLVYKDLRSTGDFAYDYLTHYDAKKSIRDKVVRKMFTAKGVKDLVKYNMFEPIHRKTFSENTEAELAKQINPAEALGVSQQTTVLGPGGIQSQDAFDNMVSAKFVNPSTMGFVSPSRTPESGKAGGVLRLALGVVKRGKEVTTPVYNLKTHQTEYITPRQAIESNVVLADQVTWKDGKPHPIANSIKVAGKGNNIHEMPLNKADYVFKHPSQLFDSTTNTIPFIGNNSGNRVSYAGSHTEQAISLKHREIPLVQAGTTVPGLPFVKVVGAASSHLSTVDGTVHDVTDDTIVVRDKDGKKHTHELYKYFPVNDTKSMLHSEALVKKGDSVKRGQTIADTNYSRQGTLALGTNLRVGVIPLRGYNYEDGIVISRSASDKLTSLHLHKPSFDLKEEYSHNPNKFRINHPDAYNKEQLGKIDTDGVIKVGQKVKTGDPLILATRPYTARDKQSIAAVGRALAGAHQNQSLTWHSDHDGEVVAVHRNKDKITVHVKTEEPMQVGDKMSTSAGGKGICVKILEDHEMPKTKDGKHIEVAYNPLSWAGRMVVGPVLEIAASKIAEKTGKPYIVHNFSGIDYRAKLKKELAEHGLSDKEELYDPVTKTNIGKATVGKQYFMKLVHQMDKKESARSGMSVEGAEPETYDVNLLPSQGGHTGGQALGALELYSLLSHGSRNFLRESQTLRSEGTDSNPITSKRWDSRHQQTWEAIQLGKSIPAPKPTLAWQKFTDMLKGAGINVQKQGHKLKLMPLTDKHILEMSNGEIPKPNEVANPTQDADGNYKPRPGGIFDEKIVGGYGSQKFNHISLPEPIPNPAFEAPIQHLLGLKESQFLDIVGGKVGVDKHGRVTELDAPHSVTGGAGIKRMLDLIDVDKELKASEKQLSETKLPKNFAHQATIPLLDGQVKKIKYLRALKEAKLKPSEAYILHNLPVIPSILRPPSIPSKGSVRWGDANELYKSFGELVVAMKKPTHELLPEEYKQDLRTEYYEKARNIVGIGDPTIGNKSKRETRGFLHIIAGNPAKKGYFQSTLMSRRQDLSMRATIIPDPELHINEVGLPKEKALTMLAPFVVNKLVSSGVAANTLDARKQLTSPDTKVWKALDLVAKERPVLLKRDPALHKGSFQGFMPKIVEGKAIRIHPLVTGPYGADFDGDSTLCNIFLLTNDVIDASNSSMPHITNLYQTKIIFIGDFPRIEESKEVRSSGVTKYAVPSNCFVPAYNNGQFEIKQVSEFSVHPDCEEWIVKSQFDRELIVSQDHSLALLDPETLEVSKFKPADSVGLAIPILRNVKSPTISSIPGEANKINRGTAMLEDVELTADIGWFLGTTIGDGWVSINNSHKEGKYGDVLINTHHQVHLASGEEFTEVPERWAKIGCSLANNEHTHAIRNPHEFDGKASVSMRTTISSTSLGRWLLPIVGKGAHNKHLPPNFLQMPEDFRRGLLCGLLDTDGTANWVKAKDKNKEQFQLSMTTVSKQLADEVRLLALSLGLLTGCTEYKHRDSPAYSISFSTRTVQDASWLKLETPHKQASIAKLHTSETIDFGRNDVVPLPPRFVAEFKKLATSVGATREKNKNKQAYLAYSAVTYGKRKYLPRVSLQNVIDTINQGQPSNYVKKWVTLVSNTNIGWDIVTSAVATGEKKTMYDITVPDAWTFVTDSGAVVWDTMAVYTPISKDAVEEVKKMMPTNQLFNESSGRIQYTPTLESAVGVYKLSRIKGHSDLKFDSAHKAVQAAVDGRLPADHTAMIAGQKTTVGRILLASALPKPLQNKILTDHSFILDKKGMNKLLTDVAKQHPGDYGVVADHLKDLGNGTASGAIPVKAGLKGASLIGAIESGELKYVPFQVHSLGLDDFEPDLAVREPLFRKAKQEADAIQANRHINAADKARRIVDVWAEASKNLDKLHHAKNKDNPTTFAEMLHAGAKPSAIQYKQVVLAPTLMTDAEGKAIPSPITKSYSEGLDLASYWIQMQGARRGSIMKVQEVRDPGTLSKRMVQTAMGFVVADPDCGTTKGIALPTVSAHIVDRILAQPFKAKNINLPAGTHITPPIADQIRAADKNGSIVIRSPMKCEHPKGLCQQCAGLDSNGKLYEIGTNAGTIAAQSLGERVTQLTLKQFHCLNPKMLLLVREDVKVFHTTIENIFNKFCKEDEENSDVTGLEVFDNGVWTSITKVQRHLQQDGTKMEFVRTRSGYGVIAQDNHPHMLAINTSLCPTCGSEYRSIKRTNKYWCKVCKTWPSTLPSEELLFKPTQSKDVVATKAVASIADEPEITPELPPIESGWLAGIYVAEGNVQIRDGYRPCAIMISQNPGSTYDRIGDELFALTGKRGAHAHVHQVYNKELATKFLAWFGHKCVNKGLPDGWSGYPQSWLLDFVSGVIDGDGTIQRASRGYGVKCKIDTTSWLLAQQVNYILNKTGINTKTTLMPWSKLTNYQSIHIEFPVTEELKLLLADSEKVSNAPVCVRHFSKRKGPEHVIDYIKEFKYKKTPYVYDITTGTGTFSANKIWTHNSGGLYTGAKTGAINQFTRVQNLLKLPKNIPNEASLAMHSGKIARIETDSTGANIYVDGVAHHIAKDKAGLPVHVELPHADRAPDHIDWNPPKVGMHVEAGQILSDPNRTQINPHTLYKATGNMERVQHMLVDELSSIYGSDVRRQHVETLVHAMGNLTRIKDPGNSDKITGELQPVNRIRAINRQLVKDRKDPIQHAPILKGIEVLPLEAQDDWLAKLQHVKLKSTLLESAAVGASANLHGLHPVGPLASGHEFGLTSQHSLNPLYSHLKDVPKAAY